MATSDLVQPAFDPELLDFVVIFSGERVKSGRLSLFALELYGGAFRRGTLTCSGVINSVRLHPSLYPPVPPPPFARVGESPPFLLKRIYPW